MIRVLTAILALAAGSAEAKSICAERAFRDQAFTVCTVAHGADLRMWLRDADGAVLGTFSAVERGLLPDERLVFAMNAGMYHADRRPVGLYVENGQEITPLTDGGGYGNFGMVPNGVFCIGATRFDVLETNVFRAARPDCTFATQSGPMLVIDGALHHRFREGSDSVHYRNGVGLRRLR